MTARSAVSSRSFSATGSASSSTTFMLCQRGWSASGLVAPARARLSRPPRGEMRINLSRFGPSGAFCGSDAFSLPGLLTVRMCGWSGELASLRCPVLLQDLARACKRRLEEIEERERRKKEKAEKVRAACLALLAGESAPPHSTRVVSAACAHPCHSFTGVPCGWLISPLRGLLHRTV
jgi:hypothetical protein